MARTTHLSGDKVCINAFSAVLDLVLVVQVNNVKARYACRPIHALTGLVSVLTRHASVKYQLYQACPR